MIKWWKWHNPQKLSQVQLRTGDDTAFSLLYKKCCWCFSWGRDTYVMGSHANGSGVTRLVSVERDLKNQRGRGGNQQSFKRRGSTLSFDIKGTPFHLPSTDKWYPFHAKFRALHPWKLLMLMVLSGGGTLGISGWGCATGTLEPLTYTRASSAKFCYPTRVNSQSPPYPRVAVSLV